MKPITVSANSQAQIQVDFRCFVCNIPLTQIYSVLKLREWAEKLDEEPNTLLESALEKVNDANFLRSLKILP